MCHLVACVDFGLRKEWENGHVHSLLDTTISHSCGGGSVVGGDGVGWCHRLAMMMLRGLMAGFPAMMISGGSQ